MRLRRPQPETMPHDNRTQIRPHTPTGQYHDLSAKLQSKQR
jgi:hypothetical protein